MRKDPATKEILIQLGDGTGLAANLQVPEGDGPYPLLVTFYPYRKDDFIGASCAYPRAFFASHGYATLLVDVRGYGRSDGPALQPWDPQEARDGFEVVEWAADQSWCDGNIGIWGTSYGGLQSLAVAAERPNGLKAIACVYGAADIYHDYVFPGGCENALGVAAWNSFMLTLDLAPPSLQDEGGRWRDIWREQLGRLEEENLAWLVWPGHVDFDDYWQSRVVPVEQIQVPSYFLSGWRDLLCRGTLEAWRRCGAPKRLLAGPWSHAAPDSSVEAPYDWLGELATWFGKWLKGEEEAAPRPDVVFQLQGPNDWYGARQWPPAEIAIRTFHVGTDHEHAPVALPGADSSLWFPMGVAFADVIDQAKDDALSLSFTSEPLADETTILGAPRANLEVALEPGRHQLCVKLCHVSPDDRSTLISSGWHRITTTETGTHQIAVDLYETAYRLPAGHRLRWTVASGDFPRVWPDASLGAFTLLAASAIDVPVSTAPLAPFAAPQPEPAADRAPWVVSAKPIYQRVRDVAGGGFSIKAGMEMELKLPQGGSFALTHHVTATADPVRPGTATLRTKARLDAQLASGERFTVKTRALAAQGRRHAHGRIVSDGMKIFDRRWSSLNGLPAQPKK